MQFINQPYYSLSPFHRLFAHYIDPPLPKNVDNPRIDVVPFPKSFDATGKAILPPPPAHRSKEVGWKEECRPDLVVMCTGYRQDWSWLGDGYPKGPDECDVRGVCSSKDPSIAFIGFQRPGVGMSPLSHSTGVITDVQVRSRQWQKCKSSYSSFPPLARLTPRHRQRIIIYSTRRLQGSNTA